MLTKLLNRFDTHAQELLKGALVAFTLKILAACTAFALNVVLARMLGAAGSGIFFLSFAVVLVVSAIGRAGMENALVRFVAANIVLKRPEKVQGVYRKAIFYSLVVASIFSVLLFFLAPWLSLHVFNKQELGEPLAMMAFGVVPLALLTLHAHALQGLKKIAESVAVLSVIVPTMTCVFAVLLVPKYGVHGAIYGYLLATIFTMFFGRWLWVKSIGDMSVGKPIFDRKELLASSIPLFGMVLMNMVITWSPILFLGIWESSYNVGIFSAASRTAMLISFVLIAVNSIAAPKFAALYQQGDIKSLGLLANQSATIMVILIVPVMVIFLCFPEWVLGFFGSEFKSGWSVLIILSIGQVINVVTGSVGYILMMSGNEKLMRNNLFFCAVVSVLFNIVLVPKYGMIGAAITVSVVLSLQNLIALMLVKVKIDVLVLPFFGLKHEV